MNALLHRRTFSLVAVLATALTLSACGNTMERLSRVGEAPSMAKVQNPAKIANDKPVDMPMPKTIKRTREANSLWRPGSRAFFKDQRASEVGDILTVLISMNDSAKLDNSTQRSRDNSETAGLPSFLGFQSKLQNVLPKAVDPSSLVDATSTSSSTGSGKIQRNEQINLKIAAVVTQVLPNGNLVIAGRQETRVNFEMRELKVAGIIRPEDITATNTISYDQIAEARVAYGGRGTVSDVQHPRYGQEIYDILWPF
jgi:flagellar L-ring protein precursor FlgH